MSDLKPKTEISFAGTFTNSAFTACVAETCLVGMRAAPVVLRNFSQRLNRGLNDAINGFHDDGSLVLDSDGVKDVIIAINSTKNMGTHVTNVNALPLPKDILRAKASMLLQNVRLALLVRFLREHCSEWADYNIDAYFAASLRAGSYAFPGLRPSRFSGSQIIMPLVHIVENKEGEAQDGLSVHRTLDLASSLEVGSAVNHTSGDASTNTSSMHSMLTIAFQFPYEIHLRDNVVTMARQYLQSIISSVQWVV